MEQTARESYLEAQVLTATPQKLRLMLIDAAIGAARRTLEHWETSDSEHAVECLIQCRNIVSELLSGIRPDNSDLSKRVTAVYVFLFKSLTEAQLRRDPERLLEALKVLEIERETWRQICEKMPHAPQGDNSEPLRPMLEITSDEASRMLSDSPAGGSGEPPFTGGLSLDA